MNSSFKATQEQIEKLINFYKEHEIETNPSLYEFNAKLDDVTISIFHNGTVMFQGKNASNEFEMWNFIFDLNENKKEEKKEIKTHIGSDEVGCGDYFGPIVVCATLVNEKDFAYLKEIGVKDSKQLSDIQIKELSLKIKEKVKSCCVAISNEKYNNLHDVKGYNLNKIKAYLHNFVLAKLKKETKFNGLIVIDQFCEESLYYKYLNDSSEKIVDNIYFTPKAENKYLAVACGSIIARDTFLKEMEKLKDLTGYDLPLGSSNDVDAFAKKIISEKGIEFLKKYSKFHFKNTQKILSDDALTNI